MTPIPVRLPVAGLTPLSTLDYPGRLACVVFLQGCPLRCGYCHNPGMIAPRRGGLTEWLEVEAFLHRRRGLLDAVVFSGGEPTRHGDLEAAIRRARGLGYRIGLHTAGAYPRRLRRLLPHLDWVGLDVKGAPVDFDRIAGRPGVGVRHGQSLDVLLSSGVALECRTTVHWRDFQIDQVERLARWLARRGVRHYALQLARTEQCLDARYQRPVAGAPSRAELEQRLATLTPCFDTLVLR